MKHLFILGFTDKHRALEVLPQLQRPNFQWSTDLHNAVAIEVETDGGLKLFQGLLLDRDTDIQDGVQWKAILSAILPRPHPTYAESPGQVAKADEFSIGTMRWLDRLSSDPDFIRNAAALLQPGNSAIMAITSDEESAVAVMSGYSHFVLHTCIE